MRVYNLCNELLIMVCAQNIRATSEFVWYSLPSLPQTTVELPGQ